MHRAPPRYLPSQQEIAAACEEIRQQWTRKEELRRRLTLADRRQPETLPRLTVPVIHVGPEMAAAMNAR